MLSELTGSAGGLTRSPGSHEAGRDPRSPSEVRAALDRHWALVRRVLADRRSGRGTRPPVIAETSSGRRFAALAHYLLHGRSGEEPERVAWTAGRNLGTDDPELAAVLMQNTAARNVRVEAPVYHLTISFDPNDPVTPEQMQVVADRVLRDLGPCRAPSDPRGPSGPRAPACALMVNRVHPETGIAWDRWQDQPQIQRALRELERELGLREVAGRLYQLDGQEPPERALLTNGERRQRGAHRRVRVPRSRARAPRGAAGRPFVGRTRGDARRTRTAISSGRGRGSSSRTANIRSRRPASRGILRSADSRPASASPIRSVSLGADPPPSPVSRVLPWSGCERRSKSMRRPRPSGPSGVARSRNSPRARATAGSRHGDGARAGAGRMRLDAALARVYRDPAAARERFARIRAELGIGAEPARLLEAEPERFGALKTVGAAPRAGAPGHAR